jgi:hypothetical protein
MNGGICVFVRIPQQNPGARRQKVKLALIVVVLSFGSFAAAQTTDPIGTIQASRINCPSKGLQGTACYALDIICQGIAEYTAYAKIITPSRPVGTIIFTSGGDSNYIYEEYLNGTVAVQNVVNANYEAVELTYGLPFSNSPGWQHDVNGSGIRAASCRYATVVQWVYNQSAGAPVCATGNSDGAQMIGEGLAHYGLGNYLRFVEMTSGPPISRVDYGCIDNVEPAVEYCSNVVTGMGTGVQNAVNYVNPAYPGPWCSSSLLTHSTEHESQFLNDSVTSPDAVLDYPNTTVRFLFGGRDTSAAIRQGLNYQSQIAQPSGYACVKDATHSVPDSRDGAQTIAADLIANCH